VKSETIMTFILELVVTDSGRAHLERQMRDVIEGRARAWVRTSPPIKSVAPDSMTFIVSYQSCVV
jgi:hypothetical protein